MIPHHFLTFAVLRFLRIFALFRFANQLDAVGVKLGNGLWVQPSMAVQEATLVYRGVGTGELVLTERTITSLWVIRRGSMLIAVALLLCGAGMATLGVVLLTAMIVNWGQPGFEEEVLAVFSTGNLLLAPFALVCGVCLVRFVRAVGEGLASREPEALERAHLHLARFWRAAGMGLIVLIVLPISVMVLAVRTGAWN